MPRQEDWESIGNEFLKPFANSEIAFLPKAGRMLAHIDARAVMRRLDQVVGQEGWTWDFDPVITEPGKVIIKGKLTVLGITKADAGEADGDGELLKFAVSDALKRCAVHFGIGRFLYELGPVAVPQDPRARMHGPLISPEQLADAALAAGWLGDRDALITELRGDRQPARGPTEGAPVDPRREVADPRHQNPAPAAPTETGEASGTICSQPGCGRALTQGQAQVSQRSFGALLCPAHQRAASRA